MEAKINTLKDLITEFASEELDLTNNFDHVRFHLSMAEAEIDLIKLESIIDERIKYLTEAVAMAKNVNKIYEDKLRILNGKSSRI